MSLRSALAYVVSLPERTLRAAAAGIGGLSRLVTDTLLPRSFRRTVIHRFLIGNFQQFVIESLGRVRGTYRDREGAIPGDWLPRKTVGDVTEAAGIFALHFSPLWFFALAAGAASGSRIFLTRIVKELKKDGALPKGADIKTARGLLGALRRAALASTRPFDIPPLSRKDFSKLTREMGESYRRLYRTSKAAVPSPEALWRRFQEIRRKEKVSFLRLSGALALAAPKAVGKVTGDLFWQKVVRSYGKSLAEVRKAGFAAFWAREARPYLQAVRRAFRASEPALTDRLVGPRPPATKNK